MAGNPPITTGPPVRPRLSLAVIGIAAALASATFLFVRTSWTAAEVFWFVAGVTALWGPLGSVIYLLLRGYFEDALARFTFSAIASHALTTLLYFGFAVGSLWLPWLGGLFAATQALMLTVAALYVLKRALRNRKGSRRVVRWRVDWVLVLLIAGTCAVTTRYKIAFQPRPGGQMSFVTYFDQTYFAAEAWELSRGVPPQTMMIHAGIKERAYHIFPHLTTMLLARYTGQHDMIRANMVYEYTVVEILMVLGLFCIVRHITGSRWAGYGAAALIYILAIPTPALGFNPLGYFFFTVYPHASSNLEPVLITSPQMYNSMLIFYGVLLGTLELLHCLWRQRPCAALAIVLALMVAAMARFRVQIFLPLMPGFMLLLLIAWVRWRRHALIVSGVLAIGVTACLLLEMRLPQYLPNTTRVFLANNGIASTYGFFNTWPGAIWLVRHLGEWFPHSKHAPLVWQIISMPLFSLLCVAGLPLLGGVGAYLVSRVSRGERLLFTLLEMWMVLASILGGMFISMSYDSYSVGGQMPFHVGWYWFPLLAVGGWVVWEKLPSRITGSTSPDQSAADARAKGITRAAWISLAALVLLGALIWQIARPPSAIQAQFSHPRVFSAEEWQSLIAMRENLPPDAILLFNDLPRMTSHAFYGGITGRRAYLEYIPNVMHGIGQGEHETDEDRLARIKGVWNATTPAEFDRILRATHASHIVEHASLPMHLHPPEILREFWASPTREVVIWEVRPKLPLTQSLAR